jgi:hypothetical protein
MEITDSHTCNSSGDGFSLGIMMYIVQKWSEDQQMVVSSALSRLINPAIKHMNYAA